MKKLIVISAIVVGIFSIFFLLERTNVINLFGNASTDSTDQMSEISESKGTTSMEPANPGDNSEINKQKEGGAVDTSTSVIPSDTAIVTITRANAKPTGVDITVLLSGISDGICTLTLTQGSTTVSSSSTIKNDGQYTYCDTFNVDRSKLTDGKWLVSVDAKSTDGTITGSGKTDLQI